MLFICCFVFSRGYEIVGVLFSGEMFSGFASFTLSFTYCFVYSWWTAVFDYTYRDYILSWYGNLSRDEGKLYHLLLEDFWEIVRQLHHRLSHVDVVKVFCNDVVRALFTHFCDLKAATAR